MYKGNFEAQGNSAYGNSARSMSRSRYTSPAPLDRSFEPRGNRSKRYNNFTSQAVHKPQGQYGSGGFNVKPKMKLEPHHGYGNGQYGGIRPSRYTSPQRQARYDKRNVAFAPQSYNRTL